MLRYDHAPTPEDAQRLEALGARLDYRRSPVPGFVIDTSDEIIPAIGALPGVTEVWTAATFRVET